MATLALILLTLPLLALRGQETLGTMINAPSRWVPATQPYRRDYDWFRDRFRCEDLLLLSYNGCTLQDKRIDVLAAALESPKPGDPDADLFEACIADVATGPALLRKLLGSRLGLSRRQAIERLRGSFIGDDGQSTCMVVTLSVEGSERRREAIDAMVRTTARVVGIDEDAVHLAGAPVDGAAIDSASVAAINRLALPASAVAAMLCLVMLRSPLLTAAIVLVALFGQALVLAAVGWGGGNLNAVLTVMPALIFVLTVSAGVHLANYFRDGLRSQGPQAATAFAIRHGYWPCLLATGTTVIGLLSLVLSEVSPIRTFGAVSSLGVAVCLVLLLCLLPGAMQRVARHAREPSPEAKPLSPIVQIAVNQIFR
ncbi:MAG: MMPL family transporter, partial [Planctomycetota bacterium]